MPAGSYNFVVEQGATFTKIVTWFDDAGDPIDVTGYSAHLQVRATPDDTSVVLELQSTDGSITVGTTDGKFTLHVAAADTALLAPVVAVYDLFVTAPGTDPATRLLAGTFTVIAAVTRS